MGNGDRREDFNGRRTSSREVNGTRGMRQKLRGRLDPDGSQAAVALDLEVDPDRGADHQSL